MLRVLGSHKRFCDGLTRRDLLHVGALAPLGLTLADFARGRVVGRTDRTGGEATEVPVSPKDVVATLFHLLGIDPAAEIHDRLGRPYAVGGVGRVRPELLG